MSSSLSYIHHRDSMPSAPKGSGQFLDAALLSAQLDVHFRRNYCRQTPLVRTTSAKDHEGEGHLLPDLMSPRRPGNGLYRRQKGQPADDGLPARDCPPQPET